MTAMAEQAPQDKNVSPRQQMTKGDIEWIVPSKDVTDEQREAVGRQQADRVQAFTGKQTGTAKVREAVKKALTRRKKTG